MTLYMLYYCGIVTLCSTVTVAVWHAGGVTALQWLVNGPASPPPGPWARLAPPPPGLQARLAAPSIYVGFYELSPAYIYTTKVLTRAYVIISSLYWSSPMPSHSMLSSRYRISSYSCRGNYSFLEVGVRQQFKGGNYSKEETIVFLILSAYNTK